MNRRERMRFRIANLVNRLPGQCWSELVDWVYGYRRWPWTSNGACRAAVARDGCYCGKFRAAEQAPAAATGGEAR